MNPLVVRWCSQPEGQFFERKSALERDSSGVRRPRLATSIAKDVVATLAAMANADGGEMVIGIEDDGEISGVPHPEGKIAMIVGAPFDAKRVHPPLRPRIARVPSDAGLILHFEIDWSPAVHQLSDGRYLRRFRDQNKPWPADDLAAIKGSDRQRMGEQTFVHNATVDDLDPAQLQAFRDHTNLQLPDRDLLLKYRLAEPRNGSLTLTLAALLLFGREPDRWHPRFGVDFVKYEGTERGVGRRLNIVKRHRIEVPLAGLINETYAAIQPHVRERQRLVDLFFEERLEYPTFAWEEAVVNAVAHRDYSITGVGIEIAMFDDRLEIRSPGALVAPVTLDRLRRRERVHASRNPHIVRVLTDWGYMRDQGEGIPRIYEEMEEAWLRPPDISLQAESFFNVALYNTPMFGNETRDWLRSFAHVDLSADQYRILAFAREHDGRFTSHNYQRLVGTDIASAQRDIRDLIRKGIVRLRQKGGRTYELVDPGTVDPGTFQELPEEFKQLQAHLDEHGYLTNREVRVTLGVSAATSLRLVRAWTAAGLLHRTGAGRTTRYVPGAGPRP